MLHAECTEHTHLLQLAKRLECRLAYPHVDVAPCGLGESGRGTQPKQLRHRLASHLAVCILQRHLVECAHRLGERGGELVKWGALHEVTKLRHRNHTHLHEVVAQRTAQRLGSSQLA
jgi:hypothetical protein